MNYGFLETFGVDPRNWVYGANNTPLIPYVQDSDWKRFFTRFEHQAIPGLETYNCTGFTTTTQIEIQEKMLYGIEKNYSDRWVGIIAGTLPNKGNNPHTVYEAIRKYGLIPEDMLPFGDDIKTAEEYFSFKGADREACYAEGRKWLEQYEFFHEWLWEPGNRPENYLEVIRQTQQTCTVGVGVTAWRLVGDEYVSDGGGNNHWTLGARFLDTREQVFDTYLYNGTNLKTLARDHNIRTAKRIWLNRRDRTKYLRKQKTLLERVLKLLLMQNTFLEICKAHIGVDASPLDEAPDILACADTVTTLLRKKYPDVPHEVSTIRLNDHLSKSPKWTAVPLPEPGDIVISPTEGARVGHVGIAFEDGLIASNDSGLVRPQNRGKFLVNYTTETWLKRYRDKLGLDVKVYRRVV